MEAVANVAPSANPPQSLGALMHLASPNFETDVKVPRLLSPASQSFRSDNQDSSQIGLAATKRVSIDHFDPQGMAELRRSFSRKSAAEDRCVGSAASPHSSMHTVNGPDDEDESFDLEKTLRKELEKYILGPHSL